MLIKERFINLVKRVDIKIKKYLIFQNTKKLLKEDNPIIFFFGSPYHSNMGDQAQTYCALEWFKNNYPTYKVCVFTLMDISDMLYKTIRKNIRKEDKIFIHSGYHLTDMYKEQDMYCNVIQMFPDYKITIFPQTINYFNKENESKTSKIFNSHSDINLFCRDEVSYKTAEKIFYNCNKYLYPDIVTSLIGTKQFNSNRDGILFCMRNDREALYKSDEIQEFRRKFNGITNTELTDTTIKISYNEIIQNREEILNEIFNYYSKYKLIITDRYHGTIFSLIAGTPVIVLSSTDHKLSSGVKWFPESFSNYIRYAENVEQAYKFAIEMLNTEYSYSLPPYFKENYYDKLKEKIGD